MPVRVDDLTTPEEMVFESPVIPATAEKSLLLPDIGVTLRKLDLDQTKYDPQGKYYETAVILPNWKGEGITELFGFEVVASIEPFIANLLPAQEAKITFQLSNDDGASFLVWVDGPDAWVPAVGILANTYNDIATIDRRIPLFPFSDPHQVRLKVLLTPGADGRQRPVLKNTIIFNKHTMDLYEDVTRSLKRCLDHEIKVPMFFLAEIATPCDTVEVERDIGLDVTVEEPIKVYNLTTDPGRNINLFASLGGPNNRTVTMVAPQIGQIEVQFVGVPDVFIGAEEFFQISKIPSVVIFVNRMTQYLSIRVRAPELERSISRKEGRLQFARLYYLIDATVRVQSSLKREALQMTDAVARVLDQGDTCPSVANGEHYCVMEQLNEVAEDRIAQGLFVGAVNLKILGKIWLKDEQVSLGPLVEKSNINVGAEFTCNLNLPSHLRRVYRELSVLE